MRFVVIDPGYSHQGGHHHVVNSKLASFVNRKNCDVTIFASKEINQICLEEVEKQQVRIVPFFATQFYNPDIDRLSEQQFQGIATSFSREVSKLMSLLEEEGSDFFLIIHTAFAPHLEGFVRALELSKHKGKKSIFISLMFNHGAHLKEEKLYFYNKRLFFKYSWALNRLKIDCCKKKYHLRIGTSCLEYQRPFEKIQPDLGVFVHPAVTNLADVKNDGRTLISSRKKVLLYLGSPKQNRGIEFSAQLCLVAAKQFPSVDFVFQFDDCFPGADSCVSKALQELEAEQRSLQNILFIKHRLDSRSYFNLLKQCDVVALLFQPEHYKHKTSGVFWDALGSGKKFWLVTKGTWISAELSELGINYEGVDYEDVAGALGSIKKILLLLGSEDKTKGFSEVTNKEYFHLLTNSFEDWLYNSIVVSC